MYNTYVTALRQQERELINRLNKLNHERSCACPIEDINLVESLEHEIQEIEEQLEQLREDLFYAERH